MVPLPARALTLLVRALAEEVQQEREEDEADASYDDDDDGDYDDDDEEGGGGFGLEDEMEQVRIDSPMKWTRGWLDWDMPLVRLLFNVEVAAVGISHSFFNELRALFGGFQFPPKSA